MIHLRPPRRIIHRNHRCNTPTGTLLVFLLTYFRWCYKNPITIGSVYSWGQKGHEIVGNVASALLSKDALHQIEVVLNVSSTNHSEATDTLPALTNTECVEYCTPLAIVADWADQVRFYKHWSAPLHYIDVRDDIIVPNGCPVVVNDLIATTATTDGTMIYYTKCSFNYTRDCPNDICAAGAIMNYTRQLYHAYTLCTHCNNIDDNDESTLSSSSSSLKESLMFLVHFMGDIHQPLHCSRTTDRGGNDIHVHYHHDVTDNRNHIVPTTTTLHSASTTTVMVQQRQPQQSHSIRHTNRIDARDYHSQRQRRGGFRSSLSLSHHSSLNLHAVWDDSIIETILERDFQDSRNAFEVSLLLYINDIRTNHPSIYNDMWLQCSDATDRHCVSIWGEESFDLAMQYAYANVDGSEIVDGTTLDEQYYLTRNPIVRTQLAIAAVRLAANLENIFQ